MKITQINCDSLNMAHIADNLYRITLCNDGKNSKYHLSARIKPVKNMTLEEFAESHDNPEYGFVRIEKE